MIGIFSIAAALGVWWRALFGRSADATGRKSTHSCLSVTPAGEDTQDGERAELDRLRPRIVRRETACAQPEMSPAAAATVRPRRIGAVLAIGMIGGTAAVCAWVAQPDALGPGDRVPADAHGPVDDAAGRAASVAFAPGHKNLPQIATRLAGRLADAPDDPQGWAMLARTYLSLGRYTEAVQAFDRAASAESTDAWLLADHAEALAGTRSGRFDGAARELVARALRVDACNTRALSLAGTIADGDGDFDRAIGHWSALRDLLPAGSVQRIGVERDIQGARRSASRASPGMQAVPMAPARGILAPDAPEETRFSRVVCRQPTNDSSESRESPPFVKP